VEVFRQCGRDQVSVKEPPQLFDREAKQLIQGLSGAEPMPLAVAADEDAAANPG
jgi:hypothetical protein